MRTTLYGYIEEMDFWRPPVENEVKKHNHSVINSLPMADKWPPLSREMFALTHNSVHDVPRVNLEYDGRIIHFAANLKSVEHELDEWIIKYEDLLDKLIWFESKVHFQTEYTSLQTLQWSVDLNVYGVQHDGTFPHAIDRSCWKFESTWEAKT
ncbi:MAG: hypothetical protein AAFV07_09480 [Bacteroidota bacterium]